MKRQTGPYGKARKKLIKKKKKDKNYIFKQICPRITEQKQIL